MRRGLLDLLSAASGVLAVAGGLLYAVIWEAYVQFYSSFGLTPADAGLSQGDIIRTAAVGLVLFMGLAVPAAALIWLFVRGILWFFPVKPLAAAAERRRVQQLTWSGLLLALAIPVISLLMNNFIYRPPYISFAAVAVGVVVLAILYSGCVQRPRWRLTFTSGVVWAAAAGTVFFCAVLFLLVRAQGLADDLLTDGRPDDATFLFEVRRDVVCVMSGDQRDRYIFLGSSDRGVLLFSPSTRRVLRPASTPDLEFLSPRGDDNSC